MCIRDSPPFVHISCTAPPISSSIATLSSTACGAPRLHSPPPTRSSISCPWRSGCVAVSLAECLVLWFCVSLLCGDRHRPSSVHPYRVGVPVVGRTVFRLPINLSISVMNLSTRQKNGMAGGVLSTAAAPLSVRRRPAAARLVPPSTGCSRGAEACRFGHVTRAARCLLACERLA